MKKTYYVIDNSPLDGYGKATEYDSPEAAMDAVDENIDEFPKNIAPCVCEYERDEDGEDEFTGRYWEKAIVLGSTWQECKGVEPAGIKYRVKAEYADAFYGSTDSAVVEDWQTNGIPEEELVRLTREWGDLTEQLEEI